MEEKVIEGRFAGKSVIDLGLSLYKVVGEDIILEVERRELEDVDDILDIANGDADFYESSAFYQIAGEYSVADLKEKAEQLDKILKRLESGDDINRQLPEEAKEFVAKN